MAQKSLRKTLLSLSIAAVMGCSWSGSAFADGDSTEALEQRITELEALVHKLLQNQQAPVAPAATVDTAAIEAKAEQAAEAKVTAMLGEHEAAVAEKTHKHSYKFGGYVKLDTIYSDYGSWLLLRRRPGFLYCRHGSGGTKRCQMAKATWISMPRNHVSTSAALICWIMVPSWVRSSRWTSCCPARW